MTRAEVGARERERHTSTDAALLGLKVEEGATCHGLKTVPRS